MGCCGPKPQFATDDEESLIQKFEDSLILSTIESVKFDRLLHRYSNNNKVISKHQLSRIASVAGLNLEHYIPFFNRFTTASNYSVRLLNCLGILLGQGEIKAKVKLLFENYDYDTSASLSAEEVNSMIFDLATVSLVIIPSHVLSLHPENLKIRNYASKLKSVRSIMVKSVNERFADGVAQLSYDDFANKFVHSENVMLLRPVSMRLSACALYETVSKSADIVLRLMEAPKASRDQVIQKIEGTRTPKRVMTLEKVKTNPESITTPKRSSMLTISKGEIHLNQANSAKTVPRPSEIVNHTRNNSRNKPGTLLMPKVEDWEKIAS
jgi:hypothetical protein